MKILRFLFLLAFLATGFTTAAQAALEDFIERVNLEAGADMHGFTVKLSAQFGVPLPRVEAIVKAVAEPADAFLVLQLAQMSHRPPDAVLSVYKRDKGQGWGVIAKKLGIKPGSRHFQALKRGNLAFTGEAGGKGQGKGKEKGKGKGHAR